MDGQILRRSPRRTCNSRGPLMTNRQVDFRGREVGDVRGVTIRAADQKDAAAIARVHIDSWRTAYRGLVARCLLLPWHLGANGYFGADRRAVKAGGGNSLGVALTM